MSELELLLNLPCVIDPNKSLLDQPLLNNPVDEKIFTQEVLPGETLATFLSRIYQNSEPYSMDCSCFAQLADLVLSDRWPSQGGNIPLYLDGPCVSGYMLWNEKSSNMGYIVTINEDTSKILSTLPISSKGQWAIQIEDDKYLGLASNGPRVYSLKEWVLHLCHGLSSDSKLLPVQRNILMTRSLMGHLDDWGFFTQLDHPDQTITISARSHITSSDRGHTWFRTETGSSQILFEPTIIRSKPIMARSELLDPCSLKTGLELLKPIPEPIDPRTKIHQKSNPQHHKNIVPKRQQFPKPTKFR